MGQQQLLLVVLSAIIVGISIVIGIGLFEDSAVQANQDSVQQDVMNIASRAREWYRKPVLLGGGGQTFTGMTLPNLNIAPTNVNGTYSIGTPAAQSFTITGTGVEGSPLQIVVNVYPDSLGQPTITL